MVYKVRNVLLIPLILDVNNVRKNLDGLLKSMPVKQDLKDIERVISIN